MSAMNKLAQLIEKRNAAELAFNKAQNDLDAYMVAATWLDTQMRIEDGAHGLKNIPMDKLPASARAYVEARR
jgi:hypothetical protein